VCVRVRVGGAGGVARVERSSRTAVENAEKVVFSPPWETWYLLSLRSRSWQGDDIVDLESPALICSSFCFAGKAAFAEVF
jgi:hypothetical protein